MRRVFPSLAMLLAVTMVLGCVSSSRSGAAMPDTYRIADTPSAKGEAFSHYIASVMYDRSGQQDQAVKELTKVSELDPNATTPTLRLIRAFLKNQNYKEALVNTERAIQQMPDRPNLWIVLGEIYHQLKRYDDAVNAFQKAIELNPENLLGYGALAELQERTNDLVAAVDVYQRLVQMSPNNGLLQYQLGFNLARINDTDGAIQALEKALELDPRLLRARTILGSLYMEKGENGKSTIMLAEYLKQRPDDIKAMEMLGGVLAREKRYKESAVVFSKLLSSDKPVPKQIFAMAYVMLLAGAPENVEKMVPTANAPIFSTLFAAFARQAENKPFDELLTSLDGIEGDLDDECAETLGQLMFLFGEQPTGDWLLQKIIPFRDHAASRTLAIIQGRILMNLKRFEEAQAVLSPLVTGIDQDKWIHYYLSSCYEELDRFEDTERHLKAFLEIEPDNTEVLNFLGYLYADKGVKLDEAEALLKKALSGDPQNPFYLDSMGWLYYKKGNAKEAVDHIQRAIYGMESDDALLREHLGDAYLLLGDVERAVSEWERAHRLDSKLQGLEEKINKHKPSDTKQK